MKTCLRCELNLPLESFGKNRRSSSGLHYYCKKCACALTQTTFAKKQAILNDFKSRPCTDCGVEYPPHVMDYDHLPEHKKEFNIGGDGAKYSKARIRAELAKCEVVCANCHRIRTHERKAA